MTRHSGAPDSATSSRLYPLGLINQGNKYFTNAVFQLLVYCPPFWNLFNNLGRLTGQASDLSGLSAYTLLSLTAAHDIIGP